MRLGVIAGVSTAMATAAVLAGGGTAAAATHLKDCGRLNTGGFGGPLPAGIPPGAAPSLHAYRVSGHLGCATVHSVMQKFEKNASSTLTINKPPAAGWKCRFSSHAKGYVCRKGADVIEDQIVWTLKGRKVGPAPKGP